MVGKKILITGGCGFVAGRIAELLAEENKVTVVDNMRYWTDNSVIPKNCRIEECDLNEFYLDGAEYDLIIHGATVNIIHGMSDPKACVDTNWDQTVAFFDSVPKHIPIIYLSTSSIYGNGVQFPTSEECRVAPSNVYSMTKLMAENYLLENHPKSIVVRLSNVYGPRQRPENAYAGVMVKMIECDILGKTFTLIGDGKQTRDFTYVDDVCDAVMALTEKGKYGEVYNIGTGIETSINELMINYSECLYSKEIPLRPIDNVRRRCLSINKIQMETGWSPKTSLSVGIAKTKAWLLENEIIIFDKVKKE